MTTEWILVAVIVAAALALIWQRAMAKRKHDMLVEDLERANVKAQSAWLHYQNMEALAEERGRRIDAALSHITPKMAYVGKKMARELRGEAKYSVKD